MTVTENWIVHDEKRRHLPVMSDQCWRCLRVELDEAIRLLRDEATWGQPSDQTLAFLDKHPTNSEDDDG